MAIRGHIAQAKLQELEDLTNLLDNYSCIGLVNIEKVPAKALHDIRDNLRGDVVIRMFKKKIIKRAFDASDKENLMELLDSISGLSSMIFTNMDPIKVAKFMEEQAVTGYAKGGDIAPIEIVVKAGGVSQYREQNGGYHRWAQNHTRIHFGLGANAVAGEIKVTWPSGQVDTFKNVSANALYKITEGQGIQAVSLD